MQNTHIAHVCKKKLAPLTSDCLYLASVYPQRQPTPSRTFCQHHHYGYQHKARHRRYSHLSPVPNVLRLPNFKSFPNTFSHKILSRELKIYSIQIVSCFAQLVIVLTWNPHCLWKNNLQFDTLCILINSRYANRHFACMLFLRPKQSCYTLLQLNSRSPLHTYRTHCLYASEHLLQTCWNVFVISTFSKSPIRAGFFWYFFYNNNSRWNKPFRRSANSIKHNCTYL